MRRIKMKNVIITGLIISVILACGISYFASKSPDGLEKVAEDKGFLHLGEGKEIFKAPMPDYTTRGLKNEFLSNSLAGLIGVLITFGITFGLGYLIIKRKK
jgi:cobalt/nickel transport protein